MVMDQIDFISKKKIEYKNDGFIISKYSNIFIIPILQSVPGAAIDLGYQNVIYNNCRNELVKNGFNIIDYNLYIDYLKDPSNNIAYKKFQFWDAYTLDINKLKSDNHIERIGSIVKADAIVAINILLNTAAPFSRKQNLEMEVFIFDAINAKTVWYGYVDVTHGSAGHYKERLFARVFKELFKPMKEEEK